MASGLVPITQHFVTFLGACSETTLTAQQIQQTVASALAFCAASGGDCSVYAALLKFSVAQGIPQNAFDVWKTIKKARFSSPTWLFGSTVVQVIMLAGVSLPLQLPHDSPATGTKTSSCLGCQSSVSMRHFFDACRSLTVPLIRIPVSVRGHWPKGVFDKKQ